MISKAAIKDGVKTSRNGKGHVIYIMSCEKCGDEVIKKAYWRNNICLCDYCKGAIKKKQKEIISQEVLGTETKAEKRFKEAVKSIEKQVRNFGEYQRAINIAETRAEKYGSIPEAMVAIELIKLKYGIIPQQKVGKYKVDFAIPKHKLIIEVDGAIYHGNNNKSDREGILQITLGFDWKIIHIPAELIGEDITKLKEILDMYVK